MSTSPRRAKAPSYRHHKPSGQAFVQLKRRRFYLGKHGTRESREAYTRFIAEHWSPDEIAPPRADLTIVELVDRYWRFALEHYRDKRGQATGTANNIRPTLRRFVELYGTTLAVKFGPLALKSLRNTWVKDGLTRKTANHYTATIKAVFQWAVSEELLPVEVHAALKTVRGLELGRSQAREPDPVRPVDDDRVETTLSNLPAVLADLVRFERLTGCRPGEARILRPCDIQRWTRPERPLPLFVASDRGAAPPKELDVWEYRPVRHKTEHRGKQKVILIGPRAQEILRPHLLRLAFTPEAFVFATSRGGCYSKDRYNREVTRACEAAFGMPAELRERALRNAKKKLDTEALKELRARAAAWRKEHKWRPNQLRHTAATAIRKQFKLEAARIVLGHSEATTTEIYAEKDLAEYAAIMRQIG